MAEYDSNRKHTWLGAIFLMVGLALILSNLNIFPYFIDYYLFEWYNIFFLIGLFLIFGKDKKEGGFIMIGLGGFFFLQDHHWFGIGHVFDFWPVVFIILGIAFLMRRNKSVEKKTGDSLDYIDEVSVFSGGKRRVTSQTFKGGKVTAVFGGSEIDLTGADIQGNNNVLDIFTMFGGNEISVPADWTVKVETTALFGGFDDKRHNVVRVVTDPDKVLIVKGFILFGGGEIKSY